MTPKQIELNQKLKEAYAKRKDLNKSITQLCKEIKQENISILSRAVKDGFLQPKSETSYFNEYINVYCYKQVVYVSINTTHFDCNNWYHLCSIAPKTFYSRTKDDPVLHPVAKKLLTYFE